MYVTDKPYGIGTIVMFGGEKEITLADLKTRKVAGVVSDKPAFLMNKNCQKVPKMLALEAQKYFNCAPSFGLWVVVAKFLINLFL